MTVAEVTTNGKQNDNTDVKKKPNKKERKEERQQKNGKSVKGANTAVVQESEEQVLGKKKEKGKKGKKRRHSCEEDENDGQDGNDTFFFVYKVNSILNTVICTLILINYRFFQFTYFFVYIKYISNNTFQLTKSQWSQRRLKTKLFPKVISCYTYFSDIF